MGNCLKGPAQDDVSLLRGGSSQRRVENPTSRRGGRRRDHTSTRSRATTESDQHDSSPSSSTNNQIPSLNSSPSVTQISSQLSEQREQMKKAKRLGLMQHLPVGVYDGSYKRRECVICMIDFMDGDSVRYLPCLHTYHRECIDDWLMRSFTCPSCMEPVDAALFMTYYTH